MFIDDYTDIEGTVTEQHFWESDGAGRLTMEDGASVAYNLVVLSTDIYGATPPAVDAAIVVSGKGIVHPITNVVHVEVSSLADAP